MHARARARAVDLSNQQYKVNIYIELLKKRVHEKSRHSKTVQATHDLFMSTYSTVYRLLGCTIISNALYFIFLCICGYTLPLSR